MQSTRKRFINLDRLQNVKPREFCAKWFGTTEEEERERGYRAKCVALLSRVLGIKVDTINNKWGPGLDFPLMPEQYEKTLTYANSLREIISAASRDPALADMILEWIKPTP
jgi:hypothetical protein